VQGVAALADSDIYKDQSGLSHNCRACAAIIGRAELSSPSIEAVLSEMMRFRNFRGVRVREDETMGTDAWKRGAALLQKHGLVMDFWSSNQTDIPKLTAVATEFPDLVIVLDHLGGLVGDNKVKSAYLIPFSSQ
jgi:predicted TIM-barrel fold metal-dependent hydrolase